jgi:hypothetical protein
MLNNGDKAAKYEGDKSRLDRMYFCLLTQEFMSGCQLIVQGADSLFLDCMYADGSMPNSSLKYFAKYFGLLNPTL